MAVAERLVTELVVKDRSGPVITEYSARLARAATQAKALALANAEAANAAAAAATPLRSAERALAEVARTADRLIGRYDLLARTQRELKAIEDSLDATRRRGQGGLDEGVGKMRQLERAAIGLHGRLEALRATNDNLAAGMIDVETASRGMGGAIAAAAMLGRDSLRELVAEAEALAAAQGAIASGFSSTEAPTGSVGTVSAANTAGESGGSVLDSMKTAAETGTTVLDLAERVRVTMGGAAEATDTWGRRLLVVGGTMGAIGAAAAAAGEVGMEGFKSAAEAGGALLDLARRMQSVMGGASSATAAWGSRLLVVGGAIGAVAAATGTLVAAGIAYRDSIGQVDDANRRTGGRIGLTRDQLEEMARSSAEAGEISIRTAREMQTAYISTGRIGADMMGRLIASTRDYAALTGKELTQATAELAEMFSDPVQGALRLQQAYGQLDGRTVDLIRTQAAMGKTGKAQETLFHALLPHIKGQADQVDDLTRAWERAGRAVSNTLDAVGRATTSGTNADKLRDLMEERQRLIQEREAENGRFRLETGGADIPEEWVPPPNGRSLKQIDADLATNDTAIESVREMERSFRGAAVARAREFKRVNDAAEADALMQSLNPSYAARLQLERNIGILERGLAAESMSDSEGARVTLKQLKAMREAGLVEGGGGQPAGNVPVTGGDGLGYGDDSARAVREMMLQVAALGRLAEAAGQGEAAMRAAAARNDVASRVAAGMDEGTARAAADAGEKAVVRQVRGEQSQPLLNQIRLQENLAAAYAQGPAAVQQVQLAEQARAMALKEAVAGTKEYSEAYGSYLGLLEQGTQAEQAAQLAEYGRQQDDELALAQAELALMGESEQVRERILGQMRLEAELRQQFPGIGEAELQGLLAKSEALARTNQMIQRQKSVYDDLQQIGNRAFDQIGSSISQAFSQGEGAAISFSDIAKGVLNDLMQLMIQFAIVNPLKNALSGDSVLPTISDLFALGGRLLAGTGSGSLGAPLNLLPTAGARAATPSMPASTLPSNPVFMGTGGLYHSGGIVGGPAGQYRQVPSSVFFKAPRFHSGGFIGPDEVPIIAQTGERVLSRAQNAAYEAGMRGDVSVTIIDQRGAGAPPAKVSERSTESGRSIEVMIFDAVEGGILDGRFDGAMATAYGMRPAGQ